MTCQQQQQQQQSTSPVGPPQSLLSGTLPPVLNAASITPQIHCTLCQQLPSPRLGSSSSSSSARPVLISSKHRTHSSTSCRTAGVCPSPALLLTQHPAAQQTQHNQLPGCALHVAVLTGCGCCCALAAASDSIGAVGAPGNMLAVLSAWWLLAKAAGCSSCGSSCARQLAAASR
jgi:hypothetical protein